MGWRTGKASGGRKGRGGDADPREKDALPEATVSSGSSLEGLGELLEDGSAPGLSPAIAAGEAGPTEEEQLESVSDELESLGDEIESIEGESSIDEDASDDEGSDDDSDEEIEELDAPEVEGIDSSDANEGGEDGVSDDVSSYVEAEIVETVVAPGGAEGKTRPDDPSRPLDHNNLQEYLKRLADSERRIHRHLCRHMREVRGISEVAATAVRRGGTVWVMGEGDLDPVARLLANGFFRQGEKALRSQVFEDRLAAVFESEASDEETGEPVPGDLLLALALDGNSEFVSMVDRAQEKGLFVAIIRSVTVGGLTGAGDIELALPVRGLRWICSAALTAGRVINRMARGLLSEQERAGELVEVTCPGCAETVLVEEEFAGRRGICPFCRAVFEIPRKDQVDAGSRRVVVGEQAAPPSPDGIDGGVRRVSTQFRPSDCSVSVGIDGPPPDDGREPMPLVDLEPGSLEFAISAKDDALASYQDGARVWLKLFVPAFLEPIATEGTVVKRSSDAAEDAFRVAVKFDDQDGGVRRKLERLAIARNG